MKPVFLTNADAGTVTPVETTGTKLIKKHMIIPYLKNGTDWVQIKKATEYERSMNPETEDRDYISDEKATTEVTGYKPSEALSITMYKGEKDFDLFYSLYKAQAIGSDAQREFMLVHMFDEGTATVDSEETSVYYAEKTNATIVVDSLNGSGSEISITVYENGTAEKGWVYYSET